MKWMTVGGEFGGVSATSVDGTGSSKQCIIRVCIANKCKTNKTQNKSRTKGPANKGKRT